MALFGPHRRFGWLPDPHDPRDAPAGNLLGALRLGDVPPASFTLRHPAVAVRDQDGTSSCVGFAWAQALELAYAHRGVLTGDLSPLFLYWLARATHGAAGVDAGTYLRAAAKVVARFGCATERAHSFASRRVNTSPAWTAFRDAYDRRGLRGYFRVDPLDLDATRHAIATGHPVVGGWRVDRAFVDFAGGGVIGPTLGEPLGGHALCILGYDQESFEIINSWSTSWGDAGYARVSPEFVESGSDLWVLDVQP